MNALLMAALGTGLSTDAIPPQSPRQLITPPAPQQDNNGAGTSRHFLDAALDRVLPLPENNRSLNSMPSLSGGMSSDSSPTSSSQEDSPIARYLANVPTVLNGTAPLHRQAMNDEPLRSRSHSPALGETSGRYPFATPSGS